jgi:hypothetical protein
MRTMTVCAAVALLGVLVACSSESPAPVSEPVTVVSDAPVVSETPTPEPEPEPEPVVEEVASLDDAVSRIGCTGWAQSPDAAPFVDQWGTCTFEGARVQVYLIPSDDDYAAFVDAVSAYGVTEAQMIHVGPVVVAVDDQTKLDAVRAILA